MGVPKFYRWISERYPKINEIVSDSALLPEFDHLYLDMNGIIHGCTHPSHMDISDVISERDMMLGIMPIPSAKDMAEATKDMPKSEGGDKPNVFDSNCITPGTEFMQKVSDVIKYFIRKKIKEDPIWRDLKVIYSGHEIPGEGEHKIMEHIRMMRSQPGYQPNTRHCIYGQDADLIMLGLVTHEPHFTILREVVDFSGGFNNRNALKTVKKFTKESDFQLLHLSVLREYLAIEFCRDYPSANLERTIDDFVFLTFLVGNDFLPHLITLDIGEGAFDLLFRIYQEHRPVWGEGNYLTESGEISDPARLERFLEAIGSVETETLEQRQVSDAEYLKKKRRWNKRDGVPDGPSDAELKAAEDAKKQGYEVMMQNLIAKNKNATFVDGWAPAAPGKKDFKGMYYYEKMKLTPIDVEAHHALRQAYIEGLMWCLAYYYRGCISWGWFYPYHYGPMLSDLRNLPAMFEKINFEMGEPILPFQQLMSCLPPGSGGLVPKSYRVLMTAPDSPILQFYPADFEVDMNGKKNPWEGVNLLPFIEINLLKNTIEKNCPASALTPAERDRNRKGKIYLYSYDMTCNDTVPSPNTSIGLADIVKCHSRVTIFPEYESEGVSFKPELVPGTKIPYPGFPSLNVIPLATTELVPVGVNCFGFPSKYPTMVLKLHQMPEIPPVEALANNVLNKSLFINWPMMHEARVVALSDSQSEVKLVKGKPKVKKFNQREAETWARDAESLMQGYLGGTSVPGSGGVQIGEIKVRLRLVPLQGMKTNPANGSTKKLFGKEEADVPLQLALWQAPAPDPRFVERGPMKLHERFPEGCEVVLTKGKYRGCTGTVVGVADAKKVGVKVQTMPPEIPFGLALARSVHESYISSSDASRILKLNPGLFGKITGSMFFQPGKYDLGLNLKSGDGLCVAGFTRQKREKVSNGKGQQDKKAWDSGDSVLVIGSARAGAGGNDERPEERIFWEYTPKAIRLVNEYRQKFPQLFTALIRMPNEKTYDATQVFGPNGVDWLPVIREWLNNVESAKLPRTPISTDSMSKEAVAAVEKAAEVRNLAVKKKGFPVESLIKIPGSALYRENSTGATDVMLASDHNDNEAPELGDRIVNLCATGIPFGARGTVIGIHQATTGCVEVVLDEDFVGGTSLQGLCSNFRGKLCVWAHVMRITVENSNGILEKMVPQGSGKAAVDKILFDIEKQVKNQNSSNGAPPANNLPHPGPQAVVAKQPLPKNIANRALSSGGSRSSTPAASNRSGSSGKPRTGSAGRGKQGVWREASGPPEKGIGFKGARKSGKTGLVRWKSLIASNDEGDPTSKSQGKTAELKAMLGVVSGAQSTQQPATQPVAVLSKSSGDPSAGLKALLGVGPKTVPPPPIPQVQMNDDFPPPPPPPPPQQSAPPPPPPGAAENSSAHVAAPSPFNFTYVEEGKTAPQAPQGRAMPPMGMPPPPPMHIQMQMMAPYGHMAPPMPMQMPHPGMQPPMPGMFPPMSHMQGMPPPPVPNYATPLQGLPAPPTEGPGKVSDADFPPLGDVPPPPLPPNQATSDTAVAAPKQPSSLVPSSVKNT
eukprot:CAMPEP_0117002688 /NCGR_PEP_ID=MMETSP0472-20121206/4269_1 /TAXON_ID=693140 ORGANISM="Tiarina fusus, Strain LIS" /NCGR_SAMPLE_ID=MMETSP0472 /ASSEMBLY_ACC=CAM_ASM_000603 /LENGTH=1553 /DNA_ID=CAMNT_0004703109 /DNA_START=124 /DNA_END=4787 /DNA_ORIENTATION=+